MVRVGIGAVTAPAFIAFSADALIVPIPELVPAPEEPTTPLAEPPELDAEPVDTSALDALVPELVSAAFWPVLSADAQPARASASAPAARRVRGDLMVWSPSLSVETQL